MDGRGPLDIAWDAAIAEAPLRRRLERDGVVVVRDVLDAGDIARLRDIVGRHLANGGRRIELGRVQPDAAAHVPGLERLFAHPNVVALLRAVLAGDRVVFTRHCDAHRNLLSGWHKDCGPGGSYFTSDCFAAEDCRVYKIGFYLQDHLRDGGLAVRAGSHRARSLDEGAPLYIASRAGDAVVFDVRLTHRGQAPDGVEFALKALNRLMRKSTGEDARLPSALEAGYWRAAGRPERLSVFFTFGAPNRHTRDFARANIARQSVQLGGAEVPLPAAVRDCLAASGIMMADDIPP